MDRTITVTGVGRVMVTPDIADVRIGIAQTRPTVAEARAAAAQRAEHVVAAVLSAGVDRADVRTASLVVQPDIEYTDRTPRVRGHQVNHQYLVTVRDLARLGAVIDGALAAGATGLDGVSFRNADAAGADDRARVEAIRDARRRAELLAGEAGVRVGEVVAIAESTPGSIPRPMAAGARLALAEAAPTPVEAGTSEVVAAATVTFAIGSEPAGS